MGTTVWVDGGSVEAVASWFEEVEAICSRFRHDSELSRLNAHPPGWIGVSPLLAELLAESAEMLRRTGGLVDPAVGAAVKGWGYDRSFELVGIDQPPSVSITPGRWRLDGLRVWRAPGVALDLGGIAKGWSCDLAVVSGLARMVNAGGDLCSLEDRLRVEVVHPDGSIAAVVRPRQGAVATSSVSRRKWRAGGRTVSHVIDPRTGEPVDSPVLSATAVAATAVEAEAAAKAMLLLGAEGLSWASEQEWVRGGLVVWEDGSVFATTGLEVAA